MKKDSSQIISFIVELYKRFGLKSPKFFQVIQFIGIIATAIAWVPDLLQYLDIIPNEIYSKTLEVSLKVAGIITWVIAKLPVVDSLKTVATKPENLPFTENKN